MGKQWKNAPVYFTVAQIRCNPVLSLPSYIPGIQECFRKNGFPDFKRVLTRTLNMPLLQGQNSEAQQPTMQDAERYIFSNIENTKNFNLEQNALSFQTTKYVTFEQFAADLKGGIGIVHGAVGLDFIERIGVRYLDAVMPKPDETLSEYLNPGVMGLYEKLKGNIQYSFSETLTHGENSSVLSRTILQNGKIGFPPDILTGMTLTVQQPFHQFDGMHAVIDTDAFYGERTRFDLEELIKTLDALHECTSASFKATITDHARKTWE